MKIRALGAAVSLIFCSSPLMAGTVNFGAVGYGQYGDAQSYPLPIAHYQFGYDINEGPFVPAINPAKESLLSAAVGSGMEKPGKSVGFSNTLDKLYPPLPAKVAGQLSHNTAGRKSAADMPLDDSSLAKGDSLLPPGSFSADKSGVPAAGVAYPSVTPSIAAWSKEWVTDTSESIEADFEAPEIFLDVSSLSGVAGVVEKAELVNFQNGVPFPVTRAGKSQKRVGNIIADAQTGGSSRNLQGMSSIGPGPGPGGGGSPEPTPSPSGPGPKQPEKAKCDAEFLDSASPEEVAKCDSTPTNGGPDDSYVDPNKGNGGGEGEGSGDDPLLPVNEGGDPLSPGQPEQPPVKPMGTSETPEPGTLLLLGGSLLGLSVLRRRNKKA